MKNHLKKPNPLMAGAGIGLMLVCIVIMLIDDDMIPYTTFFTMMGLMMSTGLFDGSSKKGNCQRVRNFKPENM